MFRDGSEFRFLHKTIGEFFAAEYLSSVRNGDGLIAKILSSHLHQRFNETFDFLAELNPPLFRRSIAAVLAKDVTNFTPPTGMPIVDMSLFRNSGLNIVLVNDDVLDSSLYRNDSSYTPLAFEVEIDEKAYTLVLRSDAPTMVYPATAWSLVTIDFKPSFSGDQKTFFSEFRSLAPGGQPLPLAEIGQLGKTAQEFVTFLLSIQLKSYPEGRGDSNYSVRVLSRELAENLLARVAEEEKTVELLNNLFEG